MIFIYNKTSYIAGFIKRIISVEADATMGFHGYSMQNGHISSGRSLSFGDLFV